MFGFDSVSSKDGQRRNIYIYIYIELIYIYIYIYVYMFIYIYFNLKTKAYIFGTKYIPVVPHKAVAEVSE